MRGILKWPFYLWSFIIGVMTFIHPLKAEAPTNWQIGFQKPVTPVMEQLVRFHELMLWVQFGICALVGLLIVYIVFQFRSSKNPTPSKTAHNTLLEMVWTIFPVIILLIIALPSLRLLYFMDVTPEAQMTVKAIGNQWYWTYEYPDEDISFDSFPVEGGALQAGQLRLFEVDKRVVVPVNTTVRVITTSHDVIHSWAVPAFGVKKDSVPGRLNETWFKAIKEGVYYGQCSELCGAKHGFMPIVVEVVSPSRYRHWVAQNKPVKAKPKVKGTTSHALGQTAHEAEQAAKQDDQDRTSKKKETAQTSTVDQGKDNLKKETYSQSGITEAGVKSMKTGEGK